jgi:HrpA-like helicases
VEQIEVNQPLLNIITPMGIEIKQSSLVLGEHYGRAYGVVKYPPSVDMGWLSRITNAEGAIVDIAFFPADAAELVEAISKNIALSRGIAESTRDPLTRSRAERGAEDGERIMRQIDAEGETVGYMSIMALPLAKDMDVFSRLCRRTESLFSAARCKVRALPNLQKQALRSISPYYAPDATLQQILGRMMPMSTLWGGFPFSSSGINDGRGAYFAKDDAGGLIVLDPWKRGGDRTNTNFVLMGVPGVGKSTVVKHLMLSEFARGTKIICIDPEREVRREVA